MVQYTQMHPRATMEMLGIIPIWLADTSMSDLPFSEVIDLCYGYPASPCTGGTFDADGEFSYPGDPPMKPHYIITREKDRVFAYQYSFFAAQDKATGEWTMWRLD